MFALASVVCFALSLVLSLAGVAHGHLNEQTFMLAGMLCLALATPASWPWHR